MEMQVSNIEKAFLSLPAVAEVLALAQIKKFMSAEKNADARKWEATKGLAKQVAKNRKWFKSKEGKEQMSAEGIDWTLERMYYVVYGYGKSNGNRYANLGDVSDEKIAEYEALNAEDNYNYPLDKYDLVRWVNNGETRRTEEGGSEGEGEGEGGSEGSSSETWVSVSVKGQNGQKGYSFRITRDGQIKGDAERVADVIAILTATNGGDELMPSIVEDDEDEDEF